ncbi:uncharacterized protein RBU47_013693 [Passerculus sandwichensis]
MRSSDESQVTFDVDSFTKGLDRILGADSEELDSDDVDEEEEFGFSDEDDEELDAGNGRQEQKVSPEELVGSTWRRWTVSWHRPTLGKVSAATREGQVLLEQPHVRVLALTVELRLLSWQPWLWT